MKIKVYYDSEISRYLNYKLNSKEPIKLQADDIPVGKYIVRSMTVVPIFGSNKSEASFELNIKPISPTEDVNETEI